MENQRDETSPKSPTPRTTNIAQTEPDSVTSNDTAERVERPANTTAEHKNSNENSTSDQYSTRWSYHSHPLVRRLGVATIYALFVTIPLNLGILGFISFLWYAGPANSVWLAIMVHNWATRSVTLPALLLRTCGDLQAGAATAMLAAIVLEGASIPLRDGAAWSIARASKPRPRSLFFPVCRKTMLPVNGMKIVSATAITLLCVTILMLQFTSTILLTDFGLGLLPGQTKVGPVLYNLEYPPDMFVYAAPGVWNPRQNLDRHAYPIPHRISTWRRNPPAYPAFAEYGQAGTINENVSDTGPLLRAFLPFSDTSLRQTLRRYTGKALVLDSRVSCQAPQMSNLTASEVAINARLMESSSMSPTSYSLQQINGTVLPSRRAADRLWAPDYGIPFSCVAGVGSTNTTSVCQLNVPGPEGLSVFWNNAGGLISEFVNLTEPKERWHVSHSNRSVGPLGSPPFITWGTPFLILQAVEGGPLSTTKDPAFDELYWTNKTREWITHPAASKIEHQPLSMITSRSKLHHWKVSASLCYTAWDTATLDVEMSSNTNRTEPVAHWSRKQHFHTIPNITSQLGTALRSGADMADRHILQLKAKDSWIPPKAYLDQKVIMPFVQAYSDMSGNSLNPDFNGVIPSSQMAANWTALLTNYIPVKAGTAPLLNSMQTVPADDTVARLFDDFMKSSNNSIAHAFSALITVLSGMAYYDQLPLFHAEAHVEQSFFSDVLFPQRKGGFWVVVVVVLLHTLLILAVTLAFVSHSKTSFVGSYWHSAIQLLSKDTEEVFAICSLRTDMEVRRELSARLGPNAIVRLDVIEEKAATVRAHRCETDRSCSVSEA